MLEFEGPIHPFWRALFSYPEGREFHAAGGTVSESRGPANETLITLTLGGRDIRRSFSSDLSISMSGPGAVAYVAECVRSDIRLLLHQLYNDIDEHNQRNIAAAFNVPPEALDRPRGILSVDWGQGDQIAFTTADGRELSEEEVRRFRDEWEIRFRGYEADTQKAEGKAWDLLNEHLTDEQRKMLASNGYFLVQSQHGHLYRIRNSTQMNVDRLEHPEGAPFIRAEATYCVVSKERVPLGDQLLMQKLMLEHDEDKFLAVANKRGDFHVNEASLRALRDGDWRVVFSAIGS